jgi:hypothetical protein
VCTVIGILVYFVCVMSAGKKKIPIYVYTLPTDDEQKRARNM